MRITNGNGGTSPRSGPNGQVLTIITGPVLRRLLHGKSPQERARVVAQLIRLNVAFEDLSPAQIARLAEANQGAVSVALGHAGTRGPRRRTLERLVKRYGPDVLMRALDQATAPQRIAAE
jgi:hypothetical protein